MSAERTSQRSDSILSATSSDLDKIQFSPRLSESSDSIITGEYYPLSFEPTIKTFYEII